MVVFEDFWLNKKLFYLINHSRHYLLDAFFSKFYLLGKGKVLIPILMSIYLFVKRVVRLFLYMVVIQTVIVHLLKRITDQPRPASLLEDVYLIEPLYHYSFPSGDTAMVFGLASFFFYLNKALGAVFFVYALLIAYGRIYVGAHFPLDVLVGALIGVLSFILALYLKKWHARPS
ncbi:lipid A 1-phosphatase LpxE [Thermocrinis sp.]